MKILVTGATGFTGKHFLSIARAAGHEVVPLKANLTDAAAVESEILGVCPSAVVHLAGISFVAHLNASDFYSVHVVGSTNLLNALSRLTMAPDRILLASSAAVYGNVRTYPIEETQIPAPASHYATSKVAMEWMARTFDDRLPIVIARPFNYTGWGQSLDFVIPKIVSHFARRAPVLELGNLHVEREYNDVRTVCRTYLALLEKGLAGEVYNVCSGVPYSLELVIGLLGDLTNHRLEVRVNPIFVRENEVHRSCGSAVKQDLCVGTVDRPTLTDTLRWMLQTACD